MTKYKGEAMLQDEIFEKVSKIETALLLAGIASAMSIKDFNKLMIKATLKINKPLFNDKKCIQILNQED